MRTWIPWEEILEENMKIPGYAEGLEAAKRELDEEIAKYGTIGNPKPQLPPVFARTSAKRKSRAFSAKFGRARATA